MIVGNVTLDGLAVPYFGVTVVSSHKQFAYPKPSEVQSDSGRFAIVSPTAAEEIDLIIAGPGFARKIVSGISVQSNRVTEVGTIPVSQGNTIRGKVTDGAGNAVGDVTVIVRQYADPSDFSERYDNLGRLARGIHTTVSDKDGSYLLSGIAQSDGTAHIIATVDSVVSSRAIPLPNKDAEIDLVLHPVGTIEGIVVGSPQRDRSREVVLARSASPGSGSLSATPDGSGAFRISNVPAGKYRVVLLVKGTPSQQVSVVGGQASKVTFILP
jgi:hypothetical protein